MVTCGSAGAPPEVVRRSARCRMAAVSLFFLISNCMRPIEIVSGLTVGRWQCCFMTAGQLCGRVITAAYQPLHITHIHFCYFYSGTTLCSTSGSCRACVATAAEELH